MTLTAWRPAIQAVVFDNDQTLLACDDTERLESWRAVMPELTVEKLRHHWMHHWRQYERDRAPATRAESSQEFWTRFWESIIGPVDGSGAQLEQLVYLSDPSRLNYSQYPDTLPCLRGLMRGQYRLAVLTNHPFADLESALRQAGIDPGWFDVTMNAFPNVKPSPIPYRKIAEALRIAPAECLFVDDEVRHVRGASATGMRAALIDRSGQEKSAEFQVIDRLDRLLDILPPFHGRNGLDSAAAGQGHAPTVHAGR
jgi:HAD superfamily hydrolase (TIGR01509 family)